MHASAPLLLVALVTSSVILAEGSNAQTGSADAANTNPPITAARLQEIVRFALRMPTTHTLNERLAVPLGLTSPGTPYETKQVMFQEGTARHGLAVHISGTGRLLFMYVDHGDALAWVCDKNGTLLNAGQVGGVFSPISLPNARSAFEAELRLWTTARLPDE